MGSLVFLFKGRYKPPEASAYGEINLLSIQNPHHLQEETEEEASVMIYSEFCD